VATNVRTTDEFLTWIRDHPSGYVVNHDHHPSPAYLILHRATCYHFRDDRDYTSSYSKTCSSSVEDLRSWARSVAGTEDLQPCGHCM
jgi:hypothetical protein